MRIVAKLNDTEKLRGGENSRENGKFEVSTAYDRLLQL
jgi:hypothetical protein